MPNEGTKGTKGFTEQTTPDDVLSAFTRVRGPAAITPDLASICGCSQGTIRNKLNTLYQRGLVDKRDTDSGITLWWPSR